MLGPGYVAHSLAEVSNPPEVIEDAPDFTGNAVKKATALARWIQGQQIAFQVDYVLADDSGLEVDALNGAPGVHSARFAALDSGAAGNSSDSANNAKLLRLLKEAGDVKRTARFKCVLALTEVTNGPSEGSSPVCYADEAELRTETFEGTCEGRVLEATQGEHGFGYDPLFVPEGFLQTFGELDEAEKNRISHRSQALKKLKLRLANRQADGAKGPKAT
jgi:XTP/dITP diphosphohydrolase